MPLSELFRVSGFGLRLFAMSPLTYIIGWPLAAAVALAPVFCLLVPVAWRREAVSIASLAALASYDVRLPLFLIVIAIGLFASVRWAGRS